MSFYVRNLMKRIKRLVFATNNTHKLEEARQIIGDGFEIVSLAEIGCHDDIPETADTLEGNALIKARWVKERYGHDCFADDTGLMVDALDGAPGVLSARYAGEHCRPADNVAKLLDAMKGVEQERRGAHFSTVIALIADGEERTFEGRVEGSISTEPHGDGGFGYDPVFVAEETGRCFAEMTADEKNAISHRGRAMRRLRDFLCAFLLMVLGTAGVLPASAFDSSWRLHPSFDGQVVTICDTPKYVYFLGTSREYKRTNGRISELYGVLFRFSKEDEELVGLNPSNLLSSNTVRCIGYDYDAGYLVVTYADGNIDLLYDNGNVVNIPGLKAADSSLDKTVNDITFDGRNIYLATNFGYVMVDGTLHEVSTSRMFNARVNSAAIHDGRLWLGTDAGLFYGSPTEFSFSNFTAVPSTSRVTRISPVGDTLYFFQGTDDTQRLARTVENASGIGMTRVMQTPIIGLQRGRGGITVASGGGVFWFGTDRKSGYTKTPPGYEMSAIGSIDGRDFWFSSGGKGFSCLRAPADGSGNWSLLRDRFLPNASNAFWCYSMAYHPEFGTLVRNHGYEIPFTGAVVRTPDLISGYKDMNWTPLSTTYCTDMQGLWIDNPFGLAIDPNNTDHVYCGSEVAGLLRLDLRNPERSIHMSKPSDMFGGNGLPGFVAIAPDNPDQNAPEDAKPSTWRQQCVFAPPQFDNQGNLWTAFVNPELRTNDGVSSYTELWVWPPAERAASTTPAGVHGWKQIRIDGVATGNNPMVLPLKSSESKNLVLAYGNTTRTPIVLLDHNGTIDDTSDDRMVTIKKIYDQDGSEVEFPGIYNWYEDPQTGLVWVCAPDGLFTFRPKDMFDNPESVRRIKVARNDGTNLADYLLAGVPTTKIISDYDGNKWFATLGAGLVCTSSDGREVLRTYTAENSELPDNTIYTACHNPETNSLMLSTNKGLCEFFLSGSGITGSDSDVRCWPNPVRPEYYGYVTIDGLPGDAMVKIVDAAGNLIKECGRAEGGTARWDVTNLNTKRVPAGVYFVIASNGPNDDTFNKVSKVLVIN